MIQKAVDSSIGIDNRQFPVYKNLIAILAISYFFSAQDLHRGLRLIRSFKSKALKKLFEMGDSRSLPADQIARIENRLATLDAATRPNDMNIAGYGFHPLVGNLKGFFAVKVTGNWRIVFRFDGQDAVDVDHIDYH